MNKKATHKTKAADAAVERYIKTNDHQHRWRHRECGFVALFKHMQRTLSYASVRSAIAIERRTLVLRKSIKSHIHPLSCEKSLLSVLFILSSFRSIRKMHTLRTLNRSFIVFIHLLSRRWCTHFFVFLSSAQETHTHTKRNLKLHLHANQSFLSYHRYDTYSLYWHTFLLRL